MKRFCLVTIVVAMCVGLSACQDLRLDESVGPGAQGDLPDSSDSQVGGEADPLGSGVYLDDPAVIGTWKYMETIVAPDAVLTDSELVMAEASADIERGNHDYQADQPAEEYWVFRPDGTGLMYYELSDGTVYQPYTHWWRSDESGDVLILTIGPATMVMEWTDQTRRVMSEFQAGDYSSILDMSALRFMHREADDWLHFGDEEIWARYNRVTTETDLARDQVTSSDTVAGTTWAGEDSDGDYYVYYFLEDGSLHYDCPTGYWDNGTWSQDGSSIYFETNNKYSEYQGTVSGDQMQGTAWNEQGHQWTWTAARQP